MCWVSWERLTLPKNVRGLGFQEIEEFNDTLLAKLSWSLEGFEESGITPLKNYVGKNIATQHLSWSVRQLETCLTGGGEF